MNFECPTPKFTSLFYIRYSVFDIETFSYTEMEG